MKTKLRRTAYNLFILLCFVSFNSVGADDKFEKLSSPNGRTFGFVTAITQDKIGEMWFSTKLGLVRYNGRNFTYYVHEPLNSNSLNSNILETVYADNNGDIWVGSLGGGLTKLDPSTGIFSHFNHDPQDPNSLPQDTVTSVLQDHKGIFWIGTHNGLCRYNPEENNFITYKFEPNKLNSLSSNQVRRLYEDSEGNLWIGTGSPYVADGGGAEIGGLNRFNRETNDFKRFVHDPENENSLLNNKVSAIYEDNKGVLWIGTGSNGIHKLDKTTGTITREIYDSNNPGIFGSPAPTDAEIHFHITFITQDITGNYWLGTTQHGIFRFDEEKKEMVKFSDNNNIDAQFIETGAWSVSNSIDGILWIGSTSTGNIYKFNPQKRTIPYTKTGQVVFGFLEESDGTLWIASDNNLIIKNNPDGSQQEFGFDVVRNINRPNNIQSIIKDSNGDIWAGGGQGLFIFDKNKQKFVSYKSLTPAVSYTHLRAHETGRNLVCRLLLE
jgi:ligand-binding sensor domain-containing protein